MKKLASTANNVRNAATPIIIWCDVRFLLSMLPHLLLCCEETFENLYRTCWNEQLTHTHTHSLINWSMHRLAANHVTQSRWFAMMILNLYQERGQPTKNAGFTWFLHRISEVWKLAPAFFCTPTTKYHRSLLSACKSRCSTIYMCCEPAAPGKSALFAPKLTEWHSKHRLSFFRHFLLHKRFLWRDTSKKTVWNHHIDFWRI